MLIALTMHMDHTWLQRLFDAGAIGVISKATQPVALATLVRETVNGHVYHRVPAATPATESATADPAAADDLPLTARELEILKLVAAGFTNGEIARRLWVTEQTVKFHLRNVYRKLQVTNRTQASRVAFARGVTGAGSRRCVATEAQSTPLGATVISAALATPWRTVADHLEWSSDQKPQVEPERPIPDVGDVEVERLEVGRVRPRGHLP